MKIFTAFLVIFLLTMVSCRKEIILPTSLENKEEMGNRSGRNGEKEESESDCVTDPDDDTKSERENSKKKKKS